MTKQTPKELAKAIKIHALTTYILLAISTGDIKEFDDFDKMLPIIKKDLEKMADVALKRPN